MSIVIHIVLLLSLVVQLAGKCGCLTQLAEESVLIHCNWVIQERVLVILQVELEISTTWTLIRRICHFNLLITLIKYKLFHQ